MMKSNDFFLYPITRIKKYKATYVQLVSEYPFLKRVFFHLAIIVASLTIIFAGNLPIFYRLGSIIGWLQFISVIGLFYGVIAGAKPYMYLEVAPKPYDQLFKRMKTHNLKKARPARDFVIGISAIIGGLMIFAILLATFESMTEAQMILILIVSLILLLAGIYFFFKSLRRLVSLGKWLIRKINQIFSHTWWNDLAYTVTHTSVSISFDRRNRFERLCDSIIEESSNTRHPVQTLYEALRKLEDEDFLIFSSKDKPSHFVQYLKKPDYLHLELPVKKTKLSQQKLTKAISTLENNNVTKGFSLGPLELNPNSYYYLDTLRDDNDVITFDLLVVVCKNDLLQATNLGLELLRQVYKWNDQQSFSFKLGTFNDGWWHNL
jgi:hypothetical protein